MKKILIIIFKTILCLCGLVPIIVGIGVTIACFYSKNLFAIIICIGFAILLFTCGISLFYISLKKIPLTKPEPNRTLHNMANYTTAKNGAYISKTKKNIITQTSSQNFNTNNKEKWKIQELTRVITDSYQIIYNTDNPETLCNRFKFIVEKVNELESFEQQGLLDKNTFNKYKTLISDDNLLNLIRACYHKYAAKAQSELKTQTGVDNRINKFWYIIQNNVGTKFYTSNINSVSSSENITTLNKNDAAKKFEIAKEQLDASVKQLNKLISSGNIVKVTTQQNIDSFAPNFKTGACYVEDSNTITRTDGKEITDEEVPYLMQLGYEKSLEEGLYNGQVLDLSFMQEIDKNKVEYTRIPTYEELSTIENTESYVSLEEISFLDYINGLPIKNPFIAQKWFYNYNLNYSKTIKNLISNGLLTIEHACIDKLDFNKLKAILRKFNYPTNGKKDELQKRIYTNISQNDIDNYFDNAKYFSATPKGKELIKSKNINL